MQDTYILPAVSNLPKVLLVFNQGITSIQQGQAEHTGYLAVGDSSGPMDLERADGLDGHATDSKVKLRVGLTI